MIRLQLFPVRVFRHSTIVWPTLKWNLTRNSAILTISVRQFKHNCIRNLKIDFKSWWSARKAFKKGLILVVVQGFLYFIFWNKNLGTLFVLHSKEKKIKLSFSCCFINTILFIGNKEKQVDQSKLTASSTQRKFTKQLGGLRESL